MSGYLSRLVRALNPGNPLWDLIAHMKADGYSNDEIERHVRGANRDKYGREYDPVTGDSITGNESYLTRDDDEDGYDYD